MKTTTHTCGPKVMPTGDAALDLLREKRRQAKRAQRARAPKEAVGERRKPTYCTVKSAPAAEPRESVAQFQARGGQVQQLKTGDVSQPFKHITDSVRYAQRRPVVQFGRNFQ